MDRAAVLIFDFPDYIELALHRRHHQVVELSEDFPGLTVDRFAQQVLDNHPPQVILGDQLQLAGQAGSITQPDGMFLAATVDVAVPVRSCGLIELEPRRLLHTRQSQGDLFPGVDDLFVILHANLSERFQRLCVGKIKQDVVHLFHTTGG